MVGRFMALPLKTRRLLEKTPGCVCVCISSLFSRCCNVVCAIHMCLKPTRTAGEARAFRKVHQPDERSSEAGRRLVGGYERPTREPPTGAHEGDPSL